VWDRRKERGSFNVFALLYWCLAKHRARSALIGLGKRCQRWPLSLHPCRCLCPVPYPCNKHMRALYYVLGRVKKAAVKLASCWELFELVATGHQSLRTPCNSGRRATTHKMWTHVMVAERMLVSGELSLLQWPDPVLLISKASRSDAAAALGMLCPHGALCLCCCLMRAVG